MKTSCYDASYCIMQYLMWMSQWHRGGIQENGNTWRHCSLALQWQSDGVTRPPPALSATGEIPGLLRSICFLLTISNEESDLTPPSPKTQPDVCCRLDLWIAASEFCTTLRYKAAWRSQQGMTFFHRYVLNCSSLWEHKNLHRLKGFQGRQIQLRGMDTRSREQFRGLSWNAWKSSFRASTNFLPRAFPGPLPGKLTLAPTQQLLLLQKFTFDSLLCMGSARTYCSIPESLGASG